MTVRLPFHNNQPLLGLRELPQPVFPVPPLPTPRKGILYKSAYGSLCTFRVFSAGLFQLDVCVCVFWGGGRGQAGSLSMVLTDHQNNWLSSGLLSCHLLPRKRLTQLYPQPSLLLHHLDGLFPPSVLFSPIFAFLHNPDLRGLES